MRPPSTARSRRPGTPASARRAAGRPTFLAALRTGLVAGLGGATAAAASAQMPAPLQTDNPAQVAAGGCQVEGWYEHSRGARAWVSAPACSSTQPVSLGGHDLAAIAPRADPSRVRAPLPRGIAAPPPDAWGVGASAKWSAPDWTFGPVRWGLKFSSFAQHLQPVGWQPRVTSLLGLASVALPADMQLRINAGPRVDATTGQTGPLLQAALQWQWDDRLHVAGEMRAAEGVRTVQTLGSELWLVPGRLGLGFSAGRTVGDTGWQHYTLRVTWHLMDRKRPSGR